VKKVILGVGRFSYDKWKYNDAGRCDDMIHDIRILEGDYWGSWQYLGLMVPSVSME